MALIKYFKEQKDWFVPPLPEHWARLSYWSSQWGGNVSVENRVNMEHYYINSIPQTDGKCSPHLKATQHLRRHYFRDTLQLGCHTRSTNRSVSRGLVDQQYQYKHKHATAKVFPWVPILYSNCESFSTQKFCCIWYCYHQLLIYEKVTWLKFITKGHLVTRHELEVAANKSYCVTPWWWWWWWWWWWRCWWRRWWQYV